MYDSEIYEIIEEQGKAAQQRQYQLRSMIVTTWIYMLVVTAVFCFVMINLSHNNNDLADSNRDLTEIIERRSPILDYLRCNDNLEHDNSVALRNYIFAYIDAKENPSELNVIKVSETKRIYDLTSENLLQEESCPDFPE
jgi:hypothetical protein